MVFARDHLQIIQNVLQKFFGAVEIKYILAHKIKEFVALMEMGIILDNIKNIVTGLIL